MIQIGNWVALRCHPAAIPYRNDRYIRVGKLRVQTYVVLGRFAIGKLSKL